jgi:hypothetical protein
MTDEEIAAAIKFHRDAQRATDHLPMWVDLPLPEGYEPPTGALVFVGKRPRMKLREPVEPLEDGA